MPSFGQRVCAIVHLHQLIERDVRVALGGGKACVAEHLLYGAQIGTSLQHVRGAGVPERVRMEITPARAESSVAMHQ